MSMKKLVFLSLVFLTGFAFAQQQTSTVDGIFKVLDENFKKYPYIHVNRADKTEDKRPQTTAKMTRLSTPYANEDDYDETPQMGEKVYITIIKNGYRYDLVLEFLPVKERTAERSQAVQRRLYGNLLTDILPKESEKAIK
jgi:hypothetical protein